MARTVIYEGTAFTIAFAREASGACPGEEFFAERADSEKVKLMVLFKMLGDNLGTKNPEKFGDLGEGLFEFKAFQIRMPFIYAPAPEKRLVLISHGFVKKKQKTPPAEISRAWRTLREDLAGAKMGIVRKAKS